MIILVWCVVKARHAINEFARAPAACNNPRSWRHSARRGFEFPESCALLHARCRFVPQVVRVQQKDRMAAELTTLESRLDRAKLVQSARAQRLTVESKAIETDHTMNPDRRLFMDDTPTHGPDRCTVNGDPDSKSSAEVLKQEQLLTPTLDLSQEKSQVHIHGGSAFYLPCTNFSYTARVA